MQNIFIYLAIFGIMFQAGCGAMVEREPTTPAFGSSVRLAVSQQIADPAPPSDAPVAFKDGRYAAAVARKYQEGPQSKPNDGMSISEIVIGK
ncbi:hypothetical protein [Pseudodesulfovibrio sp.]|uniref:hypothetical protein n=1 Tax=Pseudodesulfovibrio sp. TaxID=2035812 RepID=UPI002625E06B|nr:hypothetical protein [Pseudodesulfovibrio sp.]MDD3311551.1 hypothetical protein [Pseudodesulfovibrio sp.]